MFCKIADNFQIYALCKADLYNLRKAIYIANIKFILMILLLITYKYSNLHFNLDWRMFIYTNPSR